MTILLRNTHKRKHKPVGIPVWMLLVFLAGLLVTIPGCTTFCNQNCPSRITLSEKQNPHPTSSLRF